MDPTVLSALISGGSSLLSGLFGGRDAPRFNAKDFNTQLRMQGNEDRFRRHQFLGDIRMLAGATGFNPLTLLQMSPQPGAASATPTMTVPRMSSAQVVANAISDGLAAYQPIDPIETETRELRNELLRAQIREIDLNQPTPIGQVPSVSTSSGGGGTVQGRPPLAGPETPVIPRDPDSPPLMVPEGTPPPAMDRTINYTAESTIETPRVADEEIWGAVTAGKTAEMVEDIGDSNIPGLIDLYWRRIHPIGLINQQWKRTRERIRRYNSNRQYDFSGDHMYPGGYTR